MNNLKIKIGMGILAVIVVGAFLIVLRSPKITIFTAVNPSASIEIKNLPASKSTPTVKSYSLTTIALHNNAQSCWTTINGNVYDLTSWISQHPGGANAILSLCGIDGTDAFLKQHGGQKRPESELQSLLIGKLK